MDQTFVDFMGDISRSYETLRAEIFDKLMNSEFGEGTELEEIDEVWKNRPYNKKESNYEHYKPLVEELSDEDALKMFRFACVEAIPAPDCLLKVIAAKYSSEARNILTDALSDEVLSLDWTKPDKEADRKINAYSEALEYFRKFYPEDACEFALEKFNLCPLDNEALLENFASAIVPVVDEAGLISMIQNETSETGKHALMYAICSSIRRSDALYMLLKNEFKRAPLESKMEYAYILSAYGDGRAVTVLRKYALELQQAWIQAPAGEKEDAFREFSEARELVEDLGGNIDD